MSWRKTVKRLMAAIPSFFASVSWLALWMVWPRPLESGAARIAPTQVTVTRPGDGVPLVYRSPIVFGPPSPVGFSVGAREEHELKLLSHRTALPVRLLAREPVSPVWLPMENAALCSVLRPSYEPAMEAVSDVASAEDLPRDVGVHVGPQLLAAEFRLPPLPAALAVHTGMPWQVTARIDIDGYGRVQNVFLDSPGVDAEVNGLVEHFLGLGMASRGTGYRRGWVTVSGGMR